MSQQSACNSTPDEPVTIELSQRRSCPGELPPNGTDPLAQKVL